MKKWEIYMKKWEIYMKKWEIYMKVSGVKWHQYFSVYVPVKLVYSMCTTI
jgi:hypothetical protein